MSILGWRGVRWFICAQAFFAMWLVGSFIMIRVVYHYKWLYALWLRSVDALHDLGMPEIFRRECCEDNLGDAMMYLWVPFAVWYVWWLNRWLKRRVHLSDDCV